jgi:hypothetical protein
MISHAEHRFLPIVSQASGYIAPVPPIILCAPNFLAGTMSLGEVMPAASALTIVQGAFNWLVDNYPPACGLDRVGPAACPLSWCPWRIHKSSQERSWCGQSCEMPTSCYRPGR